MQVVLDITLMLLVMELACVVYVPSSTGDFVFDDLLILQETAVTRRKKTGTDWKSLWLRLAFYKSKRAILYWTFRRDASIHEHNTLGWHWTNIIIHGLCSALMYVTARYWFDMPQAFLGAAAYGWYPLAVSSVASVSGRSSAMCQMFNLASILSFICGGWYLVPLWFYLGMKSKEEIVTLPLTLLLVWSVM